MVEQIHLRGSPGLEQVNHPFGFGRKMRKAWQSTRLCAPVWGLARVNFILRQ